MLLTFTSPFPDRLAEAWKLRAPLPDIFCRGVSRLEYRQDYFEQRLISEPLGRIRAMPRSGLGWDECCVRRAGELLSAAGPDKPVYLAWSGGIDSTVAAVSLLAHWPAEAIGRLRFLHSVESILENPSFYARFVAGRATVPLHQPLPSEIGEGKALLITGECGDQLFGSDLLHYAITRFGDECIRRPWEEVVRQVVGIIVPDPAHARFVFERLAPIVDEAPFPIRTAQDFFWWYNFSQMWQFHRTKYLGTGPWELRVRPGDGVHHFFDTIYFQHWSLENHDRKIRDTWSSYKWVAKEYVHRFTSDPFHLQQRKRNSFRRMIHFSRAHLAVAEDLTPLDRPEELRPFLRIT